MSAEDEVERAFLDFGDVQPDLDLCGPESSTIRILRFFTVFLLTLLCSLPTAGLGLAPTHGEDETHTGDLYRRAGARLAATDGF